MILHAIHVKRKVRAIKENMRIEDLIQKDKENVKKNSIESTEADRIIALFSADVQNFEPNGSIEFVSNYRITTYVDDSPWEDNEVSSLEIFDVLNITRNNYQELSEYTNEAIFLRLEFPIIGGNVFNRVLTCVQIYGEDEKIEYGKMSLIADPKGDE